MVAHDRLHSLLQASLALNSALDLDDVLRVLGQFVPSQLGCERATMYLVDVKTGDLVSHLVWPRGFEGTIRIPPGRGIAGHVARDGRALVIDDVQSDERFDPSHDERSGYRTRSVLTVPVKNRNGRVLGVLQALNKSGESGFDEADLEYTSILAAHAAVALQTWKVVDALRARVADESPSSTDDEFVGEDPAFRAALDMAHRVARTDASVLLRGESGAGKGVFARRIHRESARKRKPFVELNCAALPDDLVESELFGVERGVATGVEARPGRFEQAHGGTLFLDEIGDMALNAQAKVLKALEDGSVQRVGGRKDIPADVRIVAATHRDLERAIREGSFREDLYYRLDVVSIEIPPLRNRSTDVAFLSEAFVRAKARRHGLPTPTLSAGALERLMAYAWPGNVRELENAMERAVVLCADDEITEADLPVSIAGEALAESSTSVSHGAHAGFDLRSALARTERSLLRRALEHANGVQTDAAQLLGISESNLRYRLKKLEE